jgi:hypothetical protein
MGLERLLRQFGIAAHREDLTEATGFLVSENEETTSTAGFG